MWMRHGDMELKHKILIPANAQFSNIEFEFVGTSEQAIDEYYRLFDLFRGGVGLDDKEWRKLIDAYMTGAKYDYESIIGKLSERQQWTMNQIKLSRVRTKK